MPPGCVTLVAVGSLGPFLLAVGWDTISRHHLLQSILHLQMGLPLKGLGFRGLAIWVLGVLGFWV